MGTKWGVRIEKLCKTCGSIMALVPSKHEKLFCSVACQSKDRETAPLAYCKGCNKEFRSLISGGQRMQFCTRRCAWDKSKRVTAEVNVIRKWGQLAKAERKRKEDQTKMLNATVKPGPYSRNCLVCGCKFIAGTFGGPAKMCSDECKKARKKILPSYRAVKAKAKAKRRKANRLGEAFDPIVVFNRSGWRCNFCGIETPRCKRGTADPSAPEIDHVVPLSRGGAHTMSNVQCLCRQCNNFKSYRTMDEMIQLLSA